MPLPDELWLTSLHFAWPPSCSTQGILANTSLSNFSSSLGLLLRNANLRQAQRWNLTNITWNLVFELIPQRPQEASRNSSLVTGLSFIRSFLQGPASRPCPTVSAPPAHTVPGHGVLHLSLHMSNRAKQITTLAKHELLCFLPCFSQLC